MSMTSHRDSKTEIPAFTAHRVKLAENQWKREGGTDPLFALNFRVLIDRARESLSGKRILDLGCLEGGYSVAFAQFGAQEVIGIEARQTNLDCAEFLKRRLKFGMKLATRILILSN
jgi:2-polyprenyl-3-methyl-5-hydroxy-6-metoxy-1,4-benzoquinol methylase